MGNGGINKFLNKRLRGWRKFSLFLSLSLSHTHTITHTLINIQRRRLHKLQENLTALLGLLEQQELELGPGARCLRRRAEIRGWGNGVETRREIDKERESVREKDMEEEEEEEEEEKKKKKKKEV